MYQRIKKLKGERFARALRRHHSGIFEIEGLDEIVRHAGDDADALLPYLDSLRNTGISVKKSSISDPFALLAMAGYDAFHADDLQKQNSIKPLFADGEALCTFNDEHQDRHQKYHIVHAVKRGAAQLNRADFKGKEKRQDAYGTSVISIQILKSGKTIKITNRYNHTVGNAADNTFNSYPDNIIEGLSDALQTHFNVTFSAGQRFLPEEEYRLVGQKIFQYGFEANDVFYGHDAWLKDGVIHQIDKTSTALFGAFLFDKKTKTLRKIDPNYRDGFADDFNRDYGGRSDLYVKDGHLMQGDDVLIRTHQSQITHLYLPDLKAMGYYSLYETPRLVYADLSGVEYMGAESLHSAPRLVEVDLRALEAMSDGCLFDVSSLVQADLRRLKYKGGFCLVRAPQNIWAQVDAQVAGRNPFKRLVSFLTL